MNIDNHRRRRRPRGMALVLVIIHSTLILSAWAVANRNTVDLVMLKQYMDDREHSAGHREAGSKQLAMAYAVALLRTGDPPASPYTCLVDVDADPDPDEADVFTHTLTFELVEATPLPRWRITLDAPAATGTDRPWNFAD